MNEVSPGESIFATIKRIEERIAIVERKVDKVDKDLYQMFTGGQSNKDWLRGLESKLEDNMQRLNKMMLELKGLIAMVRPAAAKNDWYKGEEIPINCNLPVPLSPKNPFRDNTSMQTIDGKQYINTSNGITFVEQ